MNRVFKIGEVEFEELYKGVIIDRHSELIEYGRDYFEEYCRRAVTEMGRRLTCFRKAYAEAMAIEGGRILDYGCGFGTIILTDRDNRWRGYDINDKTQMILGGNFVEDPNLSDYRMICLFDCFEHFQEPERWLKRLKSGTRLVVTIPVWQDWKNLDKIVDWRHWKPREHVLYFSEEGFGTFMDMNGFDLVDHNAIETSMGRLDSHTFCAVKR